jgi:hypothetical protein
MYPRKRLAIGIGVSTLLLGVVTFLRPSPEEALRRFHAQLYDDYTAEDQLTCPLILAGQRACPLLIAEVRDSGTPLRRYELSAIGNLACNDAVPVLGTILHSE